MQENRRIIERNGKGPLCCRVERTNTKTKLEKEARISDSRLYF